MYPIRSYVRQARRMTSRQRKALDYLWPHYGLDAVSEGGSPFNLQTVFGNTFPCILEVGFGMGRSLLDMALANPDYNFLGVDVHLPGVGALLAGIEEAGVNNVRVFCEDVWPILSYSIPNNSLYRIQVFFPDPWPKRRHHKRRLINAEFVALVSKKLINKGHLHLATDWEPYALWMLDVLEASSAFCNCAASGHFSPKPDYRQLTKYEKRGKGLGHGVWDILFEKTLFI